MNKIADRAGNAPVAKRALLTLARTREKRGAYDEAYKAWSDVASRWPTGEIGKESLMGMARSLEMDYKGPKFDGKVLISSKSYYAEYLKRYPDSEQQFGEEGLEFCSSYRDNLTTFLNAYIDAFRTREICEAVYKITQSVATH